ncbi:MAG: type II toxin-antitoxin system RelE/ParE family toxin [Alphaproteobacteria bacterium]|nr:type II toxin-antitoxin system RelE/ParE family toxin [Alphaproteobacteria bacterium]
MNIRWTRRAGASLDREIAYIAKDDPAAAQRIGRAVIAAVDRLADYSELGRPGRVSETRELVVAGTPYIVPYRVRDDTVQVLHVFHAARKWSGEFKDR